MRYYLYLSKAKLEMLYGQIPVNLLRRLVIEAKIDLKAVGLSLQSPRTEENNYERLALVESHLEHNGEVGWFTEPDAWFRGDLDLQIAGFGSTRGPLFMTGAVSGAIVAMIGSAHHVIGQREAPEEIKSHSAWPALFKLLGDAPEDWARDLPAPDSRRIMRRMRPHWNDIALGEVLDFSRSLREPSMHCEFLARRLVQGVVRYEDGRDVQVVVGTPLYVALSDGD